MCRILDSASGPFHGNEDVRKMNDYVGKRNIWKEHWERRALETMELHNVGKEEHWECGKKEHEMEELWKIERLMLKREHGKRGKKNIVVMKILKR
ncbi:hypothetical protein AVEN_23257-1 [Araneus ventricosus]|uniref:Uncharacterized protein n=1 Tax=Araneus ventricosus TaxID=182803 RepID=A0A4Y2K1G2_ARAVE|nr:hypothetical protein AVEN_23257-1 [Araneus ventricosus]